jgi:hypothetical protein
MIGTMIGAMIGEGALRPANDNLLSGAQAPGSGAAADWFTTVNRGCTTAAPTTGGIAALTTGGGIAALTTGGGIAAFTTGGSIVAAIGRGQAGDGGAVIDGRSGVVAGGDHTSIVNLSVNAASSGKPRIATGWQRAALYAVPAVTTGSSVDCRA